MQIALHPSATEPTASKPTSKPVDVVIETARASHVIEMSIYNVKCASLFGVEFLDFRDAILLQVQ
jgi:hypothetical protein